MTDKERREQVRSLWLSRQPEDKRTGNDVLIFNTWLERNRPELLKRPGGHGDTYQQLKSDLNGLWADPT